MLLLRSRKKTSAHERCLQTGFRLTPAEWHDRAHFIGLLVEHNRLTPQVRSIVVLIDDTYRLLPQSSLPLCVMSLSREILILVSQEQLVKIDLAVFLIDAQLSDAQCSLFRGFLFHRCLLVELFNRSYNSCLFRPEFFALLCSYLLASPQILRYIKR